MDGPPSGKDVHGRSPMAKSARDGRHLKFGDPRRRHRDKTVTGILFNELNRFFDLIGGWFVSSIADSKPPDTGKQMFGARPLDLIEVQNRLSGGHILNDFARQLISGEIADVDENLRRQQRGSLSLGSVPCRKTLLFSRFRYGSNIGSQSLTVPMKCSSNRKPRSVFKSALKSCNKKFGRRTEEYSVPVNKRRRSYNGRRAIAAASHSKAKPAGYDFDFSETTGKCFSKSSLVSLVVDLNAVAGFVENGSLNQAYQPP